MHPLRPKQAADRRGFALLVTITLTAFLVLILVSLAALTRVETQVASNSQSLSLARQNALFSLNLSLGQLQKQAGPDNRLTARADITASGPSHQPYLTGVWESTNTTATPNAWLVSGDTANATHVADVLDPAVGSGLHGEGAAPWVFLVGEASVDDNARRVRLATRAIDAPAGTVPGISSSATVGRYAWWIGDEGVKASASLVDPLLLANPISYNSGGVTGDDWSDEVKRARLNQLQPVRPRLERLFGDLSPDVAATAGQLSRIAQLSQLGMVAGGPNDAGRRAAFHDVTALSEAVLVDHYDAATIRLRRDLSDLNGTFHVGPSSGQQQSVRAYQQFRAIVPEVTAPYEATYIPAPSITSEFPAFHAGPVVTEFGLRCAFEVRGGKIFLLYLVEAEIWNPYAARLVTDDENQLSFDLAVEFNTDRQPTQDLTVTAIDDQGGTHTINITDLIRRANGPAASRWKGILIDTAETWEPGEIKVLSGGGVLSSALEQEGEIDTLRTVGEGATGIVSVELPGVSQLSLDLRVNREGVIPARIQSQTPGKAFGATAAANPDRSDAAADPYAFGYGYNLNNTLGMWMRNSGSNNNRDVRYLSLVDTADAVIHGSNWGASPTANVNLSPDGLFLNQLRLVLHDLPRQELVSVGDLRHLASRKTSEFGNAHAGGNNRWFDHYFFSTVPRDHAWDFAGGEPLPNRYVRYLPSERVSATLADLRDGDKAARFLLQRGAFNFNSTSIGAWRAMLGQNLVGWRGAATEAEPSGSLNLNNVFLRLPHGAQQLAHAPFSADEPISVSPAANASVVGGRRLTDAQVDALARRIVDRLKARGYPYPSVQSFFSGGLLRSALEDAGALPAASVSLPPGAAVTQADVAAQLAPVLTPRSDTFLIRSYGDSRNPITGEVDGRAWCEAVVQRVPDVTDPVSGVYVEGDEVQIAASKYPFGRKFKIVSFRWLSSEDI